MAARSAQAPSALGRELARRRGRRRWVVLVVVLVVLAVLFEAADLVSRHVAQDTIAARAVNATSAAGGSAAVAGWPFLVDLAGGNVHQVTVDLRSVPIGALTFSELDVVLTGISIDTHALFADRALRLKAMASASVRAVLTAAELTSAAGYPVTLKPDGTVDVLFDGRTYAGQVALVGGHVLVLERAGTQLFRVDLAQDRLVPDCNMNLTVSSQSVTTTCTVAPVPPRILSALSGAASS
jgi:hypothetical protein